MDNFQQEEPHLFDQPQTFKQQNSEIDKLQQLEQQRFKDLEQQKQNKIKQLPQIINAKCIRKRKAYDMCISINCSLKNVFKCNQMQCSCNKLHQNCQKGNIQFPMNVINKKIKRQTQLLKLKVQEVFTNLINKISQLQNDIKIQIQNNYKKVCLSELQKCYLDIACEQLSQRYFTGNKSRQLWEAVTQYNYNFLKIQQKEKKKYQQKVTKFDEYFNKILKYSQRTLQQLSNLQKQLQNLTQSYIKQQKQQQRKDRLSLLNINSNIIKQNHELDKLINFFQPDRVIKLFNVIFKASENQFNINKFLQSCGQSQNTLIICKTQQIDEDEQKIFGGFTPLKHLYTGENKKGLLKSRFQQVPDISQRSLLFSLTHNESYKLKSQKPSIVRYFDKSKIQFGSQQLVIGDKCNLQQNCYNWNIFNTKSCYDYNGYGFKQDDQMQNKRKRINGSKNDKIKLKEWECWKVKFQ